MPPKRHLPLLPSSGSSADEPSDRPLWQWVSFGALCLFVLWIPLAVAGESIAARLSSRLVRGSSDGAPIPTTGAAAAGEPLEATPLARAALVHASCAGLALAAAAFGAGYVVARWGGARVGVRGAAASGLLAGVAAVALSCASLGASPAAWLVAAAAAGFSALGGRVGRLRPSAGAR